MFTGIVETLAKVVQIQPENGNIHFTLHNDIAHTFKIDQSISHNGVCLTVVAIDKTNNTYTVTAIAETLQKTNLGQVQLHDFVNIEQSMQWNGRIDGHIVQGHIDQIAQCVMAQEDAGSWRFGFQYDQKTQNITVEKGSICINGVSLTVVASKPDYFSVAIIPYTYEHTNFKNLKVGSIVNIEFDILGKYIQKYLQNMNMVLTPKD